MPLDNAKLQSKLCKFPIFQSLKFKVWILQPYWGLKAPSRARRVPRGPKDPQPSAGARRMGAKHPDLLVSLYRCLSANFSRLLILHILLLDWSCQKLLAVLFFALSLFFTGFSYCTISNRGTKFQYTS